MKDFRFVGRTSASSTPETLPTAAPATLAARQRLMLLIIRFSALGFLAAGILLASGLWQPFARHVARILGFAFIVTAIIDFGVIAFLRRMWSKPHV